MRMPDLPLTGACRCGRVRLLVNETPLLTSICHCTGCQRMTASAFSTTVTMPTPGVVVQGETVIGGIHGDQAHHHHCDWCKSWMFTRVEPDMGFVNVRATMLDDATWFKPFVETFTRKALPWALADAPHAFAEFPQYDDYAVLTDAFRSYAGLSAAPA